MSRVSALSRVFFIYLAAFLIMSLAYAQAPAPANDAAKKEVTTSTKADVKSDAKSDDKTDKKAIKPFKKMYAVLDTTKGKIKLLLYHDKAPHTVENFVGLAEGTKEWTDPKTGKKVKKPFYNGLTFHRVIPGFMIQGGDPIGNGSGGPGYTFEDEVSPSLTHKAGALSMANAGPNTNGSQFFITTDDQHRLDSHYSVFGETVDGLDVVRAIAAVERDPMDKPKKEVKIKSVKIIRE